MSHLIILDRDGVINHDSIHYIKNVDEFILYPGSVEAIARLTAAGYKICIATNQSGVTRGLYTEETLASIHEKMLKEIRAAGGDIEAIEYCIHLPEEHCSCRKPQPGMLLALAQRLGCSLDKVPFVGDRVSDIQAALAVGASPIMVLSNMTDKTMLEAYPQVPVFNSLADYVKQLLLGAPLPQLCHPRSQVSHPRVPLCHPRSQVSHPRAGGDPSMNQYGLNVKMGPRLRGDDTGQLIHHNNKLSLKLPNFNPLAADFTSATWSKRKAEGKKQGLVRACKPSPGMKIIDATAGWGRDAAILASFGAEVLMLERNHLMATLLQDALEVRSEEDKAQMKLSLLEADSRSYLEQLPAKDYPDVIYIDPMHPERQKSALVKKDLQALQQIIGPDEDGLELIKCAIKRVKQRVVVKWPQKLNYLLKPDTSIEGKTVRFDIYFPFTI